MKLLFYGRLERGRTKEVVRDDSHMGAATPKSTEEASQCLLGIAGQTGGDRADTELPHLFGPLQDERDGRGRDYDKERPDPEAILAAGGTDQCRNGLTCARRHGDDTTLRRLPLFPALDCIALMRVAPARPLESTWDSKPRLEARL